MPELLRARSDGILGHPVFPRLRCPPCTSNEPSRETLVSSQLESWIGFQRQSPRDIKYMQIAENRINRKLCLCKTAMLFKFACYFPAETPLFIPINIESDAWMAELLKAIQIKLQSLGRDVGRTDLRLFKVNLFVLLQTAD